jgi:flagellar basal body-associated protein FliL
MKAVSLILFALNTLAILGTLGLLLYTNVLYKKPKITDEQATQSIQHPPAPAAGEKADGGGHGAEGGASSTSGLERPRLEFKPLIANILPGIEKINTPSGQVEIPKPHFVTISFIIDFKNEAYKAKAQEWVAPFMDGLLTHLGKKTFRDLNTPQGRYLLRAEIVELMNKVIGSDGATDAFIDQFLVQ